MTDEDTVLGSIMQAVNLRCDEKEEWKELLNARSKANYKNDLFESATRTAVSKTQQEPAKSYIDKEACSKNIINGNFWAVEITGPLLLEVASVVDVEADEVAKLADGLYGRDKTPRPCQNSSPSICESKNTNYVHRLGTSMVEVRRFCCPEEHAAAEAPAMPRVTADNANLPHA